MLDQFVGRGSSDDGRDYLPTCPYCRMEMVEGDEYYGVKFYCPNADCENYDETKIEREGKNE